MNTSFFLSMSLIQIVIFLVLVAIHLAYDEVSPFIELQKPLPHKLLHLPEIFLSRLIQQVTPL